MRLLILLLLPFFACANKQGGQIDEKLKRQDKAVSCLLLEPTDTLFCGDNFFDINNNMKKYNCSSIYYDEESKLLFMLGVEKVLVFDLCLNKEKIEMPFNVASFYGFYKLDDRYFIGDKCASCEGVEMWEFEFDLERFEVVDLSAIQLGKIPRLGVE